MAFTNLHPTMCGLVIIAGGVWWTERDGVPKEGAGGGAEAEH